MEPSEAEGSNPRLLIEKFIMETTLNSNLLSKGVKFTYKYLISSNVS